MAYKLIREFTKMLNGHPATTIVAPITPLITQIPWSDKRHIPITLLTISRGRESLLALDEYYYHLLSEEKFREYFEKKVSKKELEQKYYEYESATQSIYDESLLIDFTNISEEDIVAFLKKSITTFEIAASTVYIETFNYDIALNVVGKENKSVLDAIWEQSTHPTFVSFEGRRLAHLVKLINEADDVSSLVPEVRYIYTDYHWTKSDSEILASLIEIKDKLPEKEREVESIYNNAKIRQSAHEKWEKSLAQEEKFLNEYIQMIMLFRDIRKDPIAKAQAVVIQVVSELLRRADIDVKYGLALNIYECTGGVVYLKSIKNELVERSEGSISITHTNSTVEVEHCNYEKAVEEFYALTTKTSVDSVNVIKGQIANKGNVTGIVRVVLDPHDDKEFQDGDILVTSMTRPEFVPIMKRAGAVVTNEGGITCHAAIVSRELGIPCVIGTKNATRLLKNGDMVEVDADNGIVKILKKAEQQL